MADPVFLLRALGEGTDKGGELGGEAWAKGAHHVKRGSGGQVWGMRLPQASVQLPATLRWLYPCVLGFPPLHSWACQVHSGGRALLRAGPCGAAPGLPGARVLPQHRAPCLRVSPPLHRLILQSHSSSLAPTSCVLKAEGDGLVMSNYRRSLRHAWVDSEQNAPRQNQVEEEML